MIMRLGTRVIFAPVLLALAAPAAPVLALQSAPTAQADNWHLTTLNNTCLVSQNLGSSLVTIAQIIGGKTGGLAITSDVLGRYAGANTSRIRITVNGRDVGLERADIFPAEEKKRPRLFSAFDVGSQLYPYLGKAVVIAVFIDGKQLWTGTIVMSETVRINYTKCLKQGK